MYNHSTQKRVASKIDHPAAFNFWCFFKKKIFDYRLFLQYMNFKAVYSYSGCS